MASTKDFLNRTERQTNQKQQHESTISNNNNGKTETARSCSCIIKAQNT